MGLGAFSKIKGLFGNATASDANSHDLYKEVLLLTLARASDADTNVNPVEVDAVRKMVEQETGESVSAADVRVAAASELYETASLAHYLGTATRSLTSAQRAGLLQCLKGIIVSDRHVSTGEIDFFNSVAAALRASAAEIAGITESG